MSSLKRSRGFSLSCLQQPWEVLHSTARQGEWRAHAFRHCSCCVAVFSSIALCSRLYGYTIHRGEHRTFSVDDRELSCSTVALKIHVITKLNRDRFHPWIGLDQQKWTHDQISVIMIDIKNQTSNPQSEHTCTMLAELLPHQKEGCNIGLQHFCRLPVSVKSAFSESQ